MAIFSGGVLWSDFCSGDIASASGGTAFVDVFTDPNGDGLRLELGVLVLIHFI